MLKSKLVKGSMLVVFAAMFSACGSNYDASKTSVEDLASIASLSVNAGADFANHTCPDGGQDLTLAASITNDGVSIANYKLVVKNNSTLVETVLFDGPSESVLTMTYHLDLGKYTVTLIVTDSEGRTYSDSLQVDLHHH